MTSGGLGTMGYGFPAAVGVQIAHPEARWLTEVLPIKDARVIFTEGSPEMRATIKTPHGLRELQ